MKLTNELKNRIDQYFENISAEELFEISVNEYNFSEITFEIENESFGTVVDFVRPSVKTSIDYKISEAYGSLDEGVCYLPLAA